MALLEMGAGGTLFAVSVDVKTSSQCHPTPGTIFFRVSQQLL